MSHSALIKNISQCFDERLERINQHLMERLASMLKKPKKILRCSMDKLANEQWMERVLQEDIVGVNEFYPAKVSPDGNCLYAACSLHLVNTEELASLLRILTSLELFINATDYTSTHEVFQAAVCEGKCFKSASSAFQASLEEKYLGNCKIDEVQSVRMNASMICEPHVHVSFIAVLGLASVVSTPIHLFSFKFKSKFELWFHHLTNRMIPPRIRNLRSNQQAIESQSSSSIAAAVDHSAEHMKLFWTSQNKLCEKLDHFVPLFPADSAPGEEPVTMVKQFDGEDIFDYKKMSAIFVEIGVKRKAGIFSDVRVKKKGDQKSKIEIPGIPHTSPSIPVSAPEIKVSDPNSRSSATVTSVQASNVHKMARLLKYFAPSSKPNSVNGPISTKPVSSLPSLPVLHELHKPITDPTQLVALHQHDIVNFVGRKLTGSDRVNAMRNCWEPNDMFVFPFNSKKKRFKHHWLKDYKWLAYSESVGGAFCKMCVLFDSDGGGIQLVQCPFKNWNNALANFKRHEKSNIHKNATAKYLAFNDTVVYKKGQTINLQLDSAARAQVEANRSKLKLICEAVLFCARQNISLRGHRDDSKYYKDRKNNPGNFQELVNLMIKVGLKDLVDQLSNASLNATYRSKTTQNELIKICAEQIRSSITKEILAAGEFAVLVDEASDVSNKEQMAFVLRFIDDSSVIREEFLDFLHCSDGTSGAALSTLILDKLKQLGLDVMKCRGQGYDGAVNMSGQYNGCAAKICQVNELAIYCHCQAHTLSLCVCAACKIPTVTSMMEMARYVFHFFDFSSKKFLLFEKVLDRLFKPSAVGNEVDKESTFWRKLKQCCRTRWVEKVDSFDSFASLFDVVVETLQEIAENSRDSIGYPWQNDSITQARAYLKGMLDFEFIFTLEVVRKCLAYLRSHTVRLQEKGGDIAKAFGHVQTVMSSLHGVRCPDNIEKHHAEMFQAAKLAKLLERLHEM